MLEEASKWGTVIIRRVYGDWTSPSLQAWRPVMQEHALDPIQQFSNVKGKNATDSALIIDAMDILHRGVVQGFCIASSDSDYTRLAKRIREEGFFVMGIGRAATPAAFRNACQVFVSVENLVPPAPPVTPQPASGRNREPRKVSGGPTPAVLPVGVAAAAAPKAPATEALPILLRAFNAIAAEDGSAHLGALGNALLKLDPSFDPRTYGRSQLIGLLRNLPDHFSLVRPAGKSPGAVIVRLNRPAE